jgi:hypothetical protein
MQRIRIELNKYNFAKVQTICVAHLTLLISQLTGQQRNDRIPTMAAVMVEPIRESTMTQE